MADVKVNNLKIRGSDGNLYEFKGGGTSGSNDEVHIGTTEPQDENIKVWIDDTSDLPSKVLKNAALIDDDSTSPVETWSAKKLDEMFSTTSVTNNVDIQEGDYLKSGTFYTYYTGTGDSITLKKVYIGIEDRAVLMVSK